MHDILREIAMVVGVIVAVITAVSSFASALISSRTDARVANFRAEVFEKFVTKDDCGQCPAKHT